MASRGARVKGKTFSEAFGERLRGLREARGLTQEQLATAVKMNATRLSDYESGKIVPRVEKAIALAEELDVSLDELVGRKAPEVTDDVRDPKLRAAVRALEQTGSRRLIDAAGTSVEAFVALAHHETFESRRSKRR